MKKYPGDPANDPPPEKELGEGMGEAPHHGALFASVLLPL